MGRFILKARQNKMSTAQQKRSLVKLPLKDGAQRKKQKLDGHMGGRAQLLMCLNMEAQRKSHAKLDSTRVLHSIRDHTRPSMPLQLEARRKSKLDVNITQLLKGIREKLKETSIHMHSVLCWLAPQADAIRKAEIAEAMDTLFSLSRWQRQRGQLPRLRQIQSGRRRSLEP